MNRKNLLFAVAASPIIIIPILIGVIYSESATRLTAVRNNTEEAASTLQANLPYAEVKTIRSIHSGCEPQSSGFDAFDFTCDTGKVLLFSVPSNTDPLKIESSIARFFYSTKGGPAMSAGRSSENVGLESLDSYFTKYHSWDHKFRIENSGVKGVDPTNRNGATGLDNMSVVIYLESGLNEKSKTQIEEINRILHTSSTSDEILLFVYITQKYDSCAINYFCKYFIPENTKRDQEARPLNKL